jgi:multicomponent K+:H+ antiporter subunit C
MEALVSLAVGLLMGAGVWLVLRPTSFSVILGLTLMAYAVNLLLFVSGRIDRAVPPLTLKGTSGWADPLPQALVLTAIVISFGMTAYLVALSLRALGETGTDRIDGRAGDDAEDGP